MKQFCLNLAKQTIEEFVRNNNMIKPENYPEELSQKRGVFVTIHKNGQLRGCIGFPYPDKSLLEAIIQASISVCRDPRFPPLESEELNDISIEISILTEPELIEINDSKEYLEKIQIGKHGLIIKNDFYSALLLPQVPVEKKWDVKSFLENLSLKAGLPKDAWKTSKIYFFEAEIFRTPL
jgi:AmmeMemoRadiSam system protein A